MGRRFQIVCLALAWLVGVPTPAPASEARLASTSLRGALTEIRRGMIRAPTDTRAAEQRRTRVLALVEQVWTEPDAAVVMRALRSIDRRAPPRNPYRGVRAALGDAEAAVLGFLGRRVTELGESSDVAPSWSRSGSLAVARSRAEFAVHKRLATSIRGRLRRTHRAARAVARFSDEVAQQEYFAPAPIASPTNECVWPELQPGDGIFDSSGNPWVLDRPRFELVWLEPGAGEESRLRIRIHQCHSAAVYEFVVVDRGPDSAPLPRNAVGFAANREVVELEHRLQRLVLDELTGEFRLEWTFAGTPAVAPASVTVSIADYRPGVVER